jgi:hypothetical protein
MNSRGNRLSQSTAKSIGHEVVKTVMMIGGPGIVKVVECLKEIDRTVIAQKDLRQQQCQG